MKKILVILAAIMLATPALARTDITMSQGATWNEVVVSYNCSTEPNRVRAFALDITVDNGVISAPGSYNAKYWVYPGSIDINATTGDVNTYGSPVADSSIYTIDTLDGIGTSGITVEMGSLYAAGDGNQPATSGQLLKFTISRNATVCITENVIRGGVVLENPDVAADVNAPCKAFGPTSCFPADAAYATQRTQYNLYVTNGWGLEVQSWCATNAYSDGRQCHGDANKDRQIIPFYYRVYTNDLGLVVQNWKKQMKTPANGGANPKADIDHKNQIIPFYYRVYTNDLSRIVQNWKKQDGTTVGKIPANCPLTDAANNTYVAP